MDITKVLTTIKGKVLDATNYELLTHAYQLQQQNITQLKDNNAVIKESNVLLKEKLEQNKQTIDEQEVKISQIEKELHQLKRYAKTELSEDEKNILKLCITHDITEFEDNWIEKEMNISKMKLETTLEELIDKEYIDYSMNDIYWLTKEGKKCALKL